MSEIKPVAWTNEAQLGFVADPKWSSIPMAMWAERECYAQPDIALCRHDEAMAEIERMTASRDAYVKQRDELQRLHDEHRAEIERLLGENAAVTAAYGEKCDALLDAVIEREELKAENATLRQQLAEARNKALDEACELVAAITRDELKDSEGVSPPDYFDEGASAAYEAIRSLKDKTT